MFFRAPVGFLDAWGGHFVIAGSDECAHISPRVVESLVASTPDMNALLGCARRAAVALLEVPPPDAQIHQRLAYGLHGPKKLWRSAVEGVVSHDQAAAMILSDLIFWLRERGGRLEPSPRSQTVTALIPEIEKALFGSGESSC